MNSAIGFSAGTIAVLAGITLCTTARAQDNVPLFDPVSGYRITQYRGVVDRHPEGVPRIAVDQMLALKNLAVLIDVTPAEGAVRSDDGSWRLATPHATIPGAHWFPEAGRGVLAPGIGRWFDHGLQNLTRGHHGTRIVIFCLSDCWMSWNAALRLKRAGYRRVYWFADGIDGWKESGRTLTDAVPSKE